MMLSVGQYLLKPLAVKLDRIERFLKQSFEYNAPEEMGYYHTIHDELKELLGECEEK